MVKTATTPPEEEDVSGILISDLSNPIWGELLRLLEDQEQADPVDVKPCRLSFAEPRTGE